MRRERKGGNTLPNGRTRKGVPKFENWFCRIYPQDLTYPVWRHLTGTACSVYFISRAKSDRAAALNEKDSTGHPVFEFTATEAEKTFHIPRPTFSSAMKTLSDFGFVEVVRHGGTMDGKGIPTLYRLADSWKSWTPPPRDNSNIIKARAARKGRPSG